MLLPMLLAPSTFLHFPTTLAALDCRPEGPILPRPTSLISSPTFQSALANLTSALDSVISNKTRAGWDVYNTTFSIGLVSGTDGRNTSQPQPLWEYHHLGEGNVNGTRKVDGNSQYLIGSVTKVFTDLVVFKSGVDLDAPVTKYLPELNDWGMGEIKWNEITVRSLGEHLSGLPSNYGFSEYYFIKDPFVSLGFPPLNDSSYGSCGVTGLNQACNKQSYLKGLSDSHPITAPNERPAYSNAAFNVLSMVVEAATGLSYADQIRIFISEPIGLKSTFPSPGNDDLGVIPPVDSSWGSQYGIDDLEAPAGGLVSTLSDLSTLLHSILSHTPSILPSRSSIRTWLKPSSFVGSSSSFVGMPWEIYRPSNLTPSHPHSVTIHAKSGGAYGYRSQIALIEEYGLGVVVLSAGDPGVLRYVYDAVLSVVVPAVDEVMREQAAKGSVGVFKEQNASVSAIEDQTNVTAMTGTGGTNATFELDDDSVILRSLYRNDSDILGAITQIWRYSAIITSESEIQLPFRLFPTDLSEDGVRNIEDREVEVVKEPWRIWLTQTYPSNSDLPGKGLGEGECVSYLANDWVWYGGEPLDRVVLVREKESGEVLGWEIPFLRSGLLRK